MAAGVEPTSEAGNIAPWASAGVATEPESEPREPSRSKLSTVPFRTAWDSAAAHSLSSRVTEAGLVGGASDDAASGEGNDKVPVEAISNVGEAAKSRDSAPPPSDAGALGWPTPSGDDGGDLTCDGTTAAFDGGCDTVGDGGAMARLGSGDASPLGDLLAGRRPSSADARAPVRSRVAGSREFRGSPPASALDGDCGPSAGDAEAAAGRATSASEGAAVGSESCAVPSAASEVAVAACVVASEPRGTTSGPCTAASEGGATTSETCVAVSKAAATTSETCVAVSEACATASEPVAAASLPTVAAPWSSGWVRWKFCTSRSRRASASLRCSTTPSTLSRTPLSSTAAPCAALGASLGATPEAPAASWLDGKLVGTSLVFTGVPGSDPIMEDVCELSTPGMQPPSRNARTFKQPWTPTTHHGEHLQG